MNSPPSRVLAKKSRHAKKSAKKTKTPKKPWDASTSDLTVHKLPKRRLMERKLLMMTPTTELLYPHGKPDHVPISPVKKHTSPVPPLQLKPFVVGKVQYHYPTSDSHNKENEKYEDDESNLSVEKLYAFEEYNDAEPKMPVKEPLKEINLDDEVRLFERKRKNIPTSRDQVKQGKTSRVSVPSTMTSNTENLTQSMGSTMESMDEWAKIEADARRTNDMLYASLMDNSDTVQEHNKSVLLETPIMETSVVGSKECDDSLTQVRKVVQRYETWKKIVTDSDGKNQAALLSKVVLYMNDSLDMNISEEKFRASLLDTLNSCSQEMQNMTSKIDALEEENEMLRKQLHQQLVHPLTTTETELLPEIPEHSSTNDSNIIFGRTFHRLPPRPSALSFDKEESEDVSAMVEEEISDNREEAVQLFVQASPEKRDVNSSKDMYDRRYNPHDYNDGELIRQNSFGPLAEEGENLMAQFSTPQRKKKESVFLMDAFADVEGEAEESNDDDMEEEISLDIPVPSSKPVKKGETIVNSWVGNNVSVMVPGVKYKAVTPAATPQKPKEVVTFMSPPTRDEKTAPKSVQWSSPYGQYEIDSILNAPEFRTPVKKTKKSPQKSPHIDGMQSLDSPAITVNKRLILKSGSPAFMRQRQYLEGY